MGDITISCLAGLAAVVDMTSTKYSNVKADHTGTSDWVLDPMHVTPKVTCVDISAGIKINNVSS